MEWIDWLVVGVVIVFIVAVIWRTKKYSTSVSDFLAANRCAGRYLICISQGFAASGVVGLIGTMQIKYNTGFADGWWFHFITPLILLLGLSGWIVYRFRQTRAMTLGQFFEMRYSKSFRKFAGILGFLAGIINFGIWPAIGADFFMAYCKLPSEIGGVPFYPILLCILLFASYYTLLGGQVTAIVSDFLQGMLFNLTMVAILIIVLIKFSIGDIFDCLAVSPSGKSMVNPFDIAGNSGYTIWFFVINILIQLYGYKTWQGESGYNCAARTPHEAKMAGVLGTYRWWGFLVALTVLPMVTYLLMHDSAYTDTAKNIETELSSIANPEIRNQMTTPIAMKQFIPVGLLGCFAASVFAAFIGSVGTQLHSWGSIFIQDAVLPFKKDNLSAKTHIKWLRIAIFGVALFVFLFSMFFRQTQRMQMYFMVSGTIFMSGAGAALIGGLYWKKGTAKGAWAAMLSGAVISIVALILEQVWVFLYHVSFPLDFKWMALISIIIASINYIVFSLLDYKHDFNMDEMLHRGQYSVDGDSQALPQKKWSLKSIIGITSEFTLGDKLIYAYSLGWGWLICLLAIGVTSVSLIWGLSNNTWARIHKYILCYFLCISFVIALWLTLGGFKDLRRFFVDLKNSRKEESDDGRVD